MKYIIAGEILKILRNTPDLRRKLKVFALVAALGVVLVGGAAIYATVRGVSYVADAARQVDLSTVSPSITEQLKDPARRLGGDCLTVARGLLNVDALLGVPLMESARNLKNACLGPTPEVSPKQEESKVI